MGDHLGVHAEGERVVTHHFACVRAGYPGWHWSVTLTRAKRGKDMTVNEVVLLPGDEAIVAPAWLPYKERLQPGDLSPGDLLPVEDEDVRLVPTYLVGDDPLDTPLDGDARAQVRRVAEDLGLGRVRTLSREGLDMAAERWHDGDGGPEAPLAKSAPDHCWSCGFLVRLNGSLSDTLRRLRQRQRQRRRQGGHLRPRLRRPLRGQARAQAAAAAHARARLRHAHRRRASRRCRDQALLGQAASSTQTAYSSWGSWSS